VEATIAARVSSEDVEHVAPMPLGRRETDEEKEHGDALHESDRAARRRR
jgi:hypothetical protein